MSRAIEIALLLVCMLGITASVFFAVTAYSGGYTQYCAIFAGHAVLFAVLLTIIVSTPSTPKYTA